MMRLGTGRIRVVTFDAMKTLINLRDPVGKIYSDFLRDRFRLCLDAELLQEAFLENYRRHDRQWPCFGYHVTNDHRSFGEAQKRWWIGVASATLSSVAGRVEDNRMYRMCSQLYDYFATAEPWVLDPSVNHLLGHLTRKGMTLAILSNYDSRLRRILTHFGVLGYFHALFLSGETGLAKPDERLFRLVERTLIADPDEIMHVGDDLEKDYNGARSAGWRAVLLGKADSGVDTKDVITSMKDLQWRVS